MNIIYNIFMADSVKKKFTLINEFYFYKTIFIISNFFIYAYYQILLYKETGSLSILVADWLIFHLAIWIGFIFGSLIIEKLGYVNTFKLSFVLLGLSSLVIALNVHSITTFYVLFAIIRAFPRGFFWPIHHTYLLREFRTEERNGIISSIESLGYILSIIFPVLIGLILSTSSDYSLVFLIGAFILLLAAMVPWKYNKKPEAQITSKEILRIIKDSKFKSYAIINIIGAGMDVNIILIFLIIPFLFTQSEFEVGLIASAMNLIAAFFVFSRRKRKIEQEIRIGYVGHIIYSFAIFVFTFIFTFPMMLIRGLIAIVTGSMVNPLEQKIDLKIRQNILGKDIKESAVEMNIVIETLYLIGRVIALGILLVLVNINIEDKLLGFKIFIFIQGIWYFVYYVILLRLLKPKQQEEIEDKPVYLHSQSLVAHR